MLPLSLPARFLASPDKPSWLFTILCHSLSLVPGIVGVLVRRGFYVIALRGCARDVSIGFGTTFAVRGTTIGKNTYIGNFCSIGLASIGSDVLIGSNVDLIGSPRLHDFSRTDVPIKSQGGEIAYVNVGDGCWIGNSSVILADVGSECVVGAGAVLAEAAENWGIYVGNPARKVRDRRAD